MLSCLQALARSVAGETLGGDRMPESTRLPPTASESSKQSINPPEGRRDVAALLRVVRNSSSIFHSCLRQSRSLKFIGNRGTKGRVPNW